MNGYGGSEKVNRYRIYWRLIEGEPFAGTIWNSRFGDITEIRSDFWPSMDRIVREIGEDNLIDNQIIVVVNASNPDGKGACKVYRFNRQKVVKITKSLTPIN